jgi:hypothetical protein
MVAIMRDAVLRIPNSVLRPRILGLTASFNNGSMRDVIQKRQELEEVLTASMFCPDVTEFLATRHKTYRTVYFDGTPPDPSAVLCIEQKTTELLAPHRAWLLDTRKVVATAVAVFTNIGLAGYHYYVREGIARQLEQHARVLGEQGIFAARAMTRELPALRSALWEEACKLMACKTLTILPQVSSKVQRLLELLEDRHTHYGALRALIFVARVACTNPLVELINVHFHSDGTPTLAAEAVTGTGAMSEEERERHLAAFREGKIPILVCTASLEEGIDVAECNVVVRFDAFDTTKQHIQVPCCVVATDAERWHLRSCAPPLY